MSIVYFLGRLHVVVLHLPIGILLVTLAVEWLTRRGRLKASDELISFLWWASAATAVVTAMLGLLHAQEGNSGAAVALHRAFGLAFAATVTAACVMRQWRAPLYRMVQLPLAIALIVLVTLTGHYGGNVTHGSAYLVEYAPQPLRTLAGLEPRRTIITDPAKADAYLDVVQPIFDAHCTSCHGDDHLKGGLSLARRAKVMAGGKDGPVIVPGKPQASELIRRISLPVDDEHFMPAQGKPPLSEHEKQLIAWWIAAGAPADKTVAQLAPLPGVRGADAASAAAAESSADQAASSIAAKVPAASPEVIAKLTQLGFVIRPVAVGSPLLEVAFTKGRHVDASTLASLLGIKDQIVELNLRAAGLQDAQLRVIAQLAHLEHLRIELNDITDAGVRQLATLGTLRSLNLYGTRVTDATLETLGHMPALRDVYLFQTAVTDARLAEAQAANKMCALHKG